MNWHIKEDLQQTHFTNSIIVYVPGKVSAVPTLTVNIHYEKASFRPQDQFAE